METIAKINQKFTAGQKLATRSFCDYDCIFRATVVKRTAKTLTVSIRGNEKRCKVYTDDHGNEYIYPMGQYSMAPGFFADADHDI